MVNYLSQNINDILSIARLAPSVHNTQPWKVEIETDMLKIMLDRKRALAHGDPTGRQIYISLGIFTEACRLSLLYHGLSPDEPKFDNDVISIGTGQKAGRSATDDVEALKRRFTDRTVYKKTDITPEIIAQLDSAWHTADVEVLATADPKVIEQTAALTKQALLLAFSNPDFRRELTRHFVAKASVGHGIPLAALGTGRLKTRFVKRLINSGFNRKQEAQTEYNRWRSASGLVFVLAGGDSKPYWIESGQAYLRASLEIQKLGLNQATSAAIVEAADFHEDIENLLGTNKRILSVMRIGRGQKKRRESGRLTTEELLAT